jgi:hypothetical protein
MKFILLTHKASKSKMFININHIISIAEHNKKISGILLVTGEIIEVLEDIDEIINQINHKNNIPEII